MRPDLATIDELVNPDDLPVLVAHLHAIGVRTLFRFAAQTDVLGDATQQIADLDQGGRPTDVGDADVTHGYRPSTTSRAWSPSAPVISR